MLGQIPGFSFIGELEYVWQNCFAENQPCGCGASFTSCDFWKKVVHETFDGFDRVDLDEIMKLKHSVDRMRHIPQLASPWKRSACLESLMRYSQVLGRFYAAIRNVSGSQVIIDSSKVPSYGYTLANLPDIDLRVVHLVRDSRAVAYSCLRKKLKYEVGDKKIYMDQHGPVNSSLGWMRSNFLIESLRFLMPARYMRVRYEDLVNEAEETLVRILALLGENDARLPLTDGQVELGVDHAVEGNPMRFGQGAVELCLDEEWKKGMKRTDRRVTTALTWPLLLKYGYLVGRN
jgi:hypothetical protein